MDNPAAWHPDPIGRHEYRWWDGSQWTEHVADGGVAAVDPIEAAAPAQSEAATPAQTETTPAPHEPETPLGGESDAPADDASGAPAPAFGSTSPDTPTEGSWSQPGGTEPMPAVEPEPQQPYQQQPQQPYQEPQQPAQPYQQQPSQAGTTDQVGAWPAAGNQAASGGQPSNGLAIAALIVGIIALLIAWIPFIGLLGGLGGALAIVFGFIGRSKVKKQGASGKGAATGGIVIGIIALLLSIFATAAVFIFGQQLFGDTFGSFVECVEETGDEAFCEQQLEDDLFNRFGVPDAG